MCWCARDPPGCTVLEGKYTVSVMQWHLSSSASIHCKALYGCSQMNSPGGLHAVSLHRGTGATTHPALAKAATAKGSPQFSNTLQMLLVWLSQRARPPMHLHVPKAVSLSIKFTLVTFTIACFICGAGSPCFFNPSLSSCLLFSSFLTSYSSTGYIHIFS